MTIYYAKPSATGTGDGSSWANADDLAGAYASAGNGDEVWAVAGTYTVKLTPKNGVTLRGGFDATTPETVAANRDLANNITTVDGQNTDRCFGHLDCTSNVTAVIEAIRCYRGYADDYEVPIEWEGVFSLEIAGSSTVDITFSRCRFEACTGLIGSTVAIYDDGGGGSGKIRLENCTEFDCICIDDELAAYVENGGTMEVVNCALTDTDAGAAILGRISGGTITVTNSVLWVINNTVATPYSGTITFTYCDVADAAPAGAGNISSDPLWTDAANGDFTFSSSSPLIDAGNGTAAPSTDMWLRARVDDPSTSNTGTGTPAYSDIGPLEFQVASTPELQPGAVSPSGSFANPTIAKATVPVLQPGVAAASASYPGPTIALSDLTAQPDALAPSGSFPNPTVAKAAVPTVQPGVASSSATFPGPTIALSDLTAQPDALAPSGLFPGSTVAKAAVPALQPGAAGATGSFPGPTIAPAAVPELQPGTAAPSATFPGPAVALSDLTAQPDPLAPSGAFPGPSVAKASVPALQPGAVAPSGSFPGPAVALSDLTAQPGTASPTGSFPAPAIAKATVPVVQPAAVAPSGSFPGPAVSKALGYTTGLRYRLEADTDNVTVVSGKVSAWGDTSGSATDHDHAQTSDPARPDWNTVQLNSYPTITFGTAEYLETPSSADLDIEQGSWIWWAVINRDQIAGFRILRAFGSNASADHLRIYANSSNQLFVVWGADGSAYAAGSVAIPDEEWTLLICAVDSAAGEVILRVGQAQERNSETISGTGTSSIPGTIASASGATHNFHLREEAFHVLGDGVAVSDADLNAIARYVEAKYGIDVLAPEAQPGVALPSGSFPDPTVSKAAVPALQPDPAGSSSTFPAPTVAKATPPELQPGAAAPSGTYPGPTVAPATPALVQPDATASSASFPAPTVAPAPVPTVLPGSAAPSASYPAPTLAPSTIPALQPGQAAPAGTFPGPTIALAPVPALQPDVAAPSGLFPEPSIVKSADISPGSAPATSSFPGPTLAKVIPLEVGPPDALAPTATFPPPAIFKDGLGVRPAVFSGSARTSAQFASGPATGAQFSSSARTAAKFRKP